MTPESITILICVATFIISVGCSLFIAGIRWGGVNKDIEYIKRDLETIKSMFQLTLIAGQPPKRDH